MNTTNLNRRLKGYTRTKLRASNEDSAVVDVIDDLQSITSDDDHSIDTSHDTGDVIDAEYLPNPAIVTEMMTEINETPEITNADTAVKLLSDSNEALRRLDIIHMNVNYPVSGYRASQATVMKAEPGLESLMTTKTFTRRQLAGGIESTKMKIIKEAWKTFVAWVRKTISETVAWIRKKTNRVKDVQDDIKDIVREVNSMEDVAFSEVGEEIKEKAPKMYAETTKTEAPSAKETTKRGRNSGKEMVTVDASATSATEVVPMRVYVQALYSEHSWDYLSEYVRTMLMYPDKAKALLNYADGTLVDLATYIANCNSQLDMVKQAYSSEPGQVHADTKEVFKKDEEKYGSIGEELASVSHDIATARHTVDLSKPVPIADFLKRAGQFTESYNKLKLDNLVRSQASIDKLLQDLTVFHDKVVADDTHKTSLWAVEDIKKRVTAVGKVFLTFKILVKSMDMMGVALNDLNTSINQAKLKPVR